MSPCSDSPSAAGVPRVNVSHKGAEPDDPHRRMVEEAKGVAEVETGGEAVSARRVELNGTWSTDGYGGVEVLVHMPRRKEGWRCLIDINTMKLRKKETIPNPPSKVR